MITALFILFYYLIHAVVSIVMTLRFTVLFILLYFYCSIHNVLLFYYTLCFTIIHRVSRQSVFAFGLEAINFNQMKFPEVLE